MGKRGWIVLLPYKAFGIIWRLGCVGTLSCLDPEAQVVGGFEIKGSDVQARLL